MSSNSACSDNFTRPVWATMRSCLNNSARKAFTSARFVWMDHLHCFTKWLDMISCEIVCMTCVKTVLQMQQGEDTSNVQSSSLAGHWCGQMSVETPNVQRSSRLLLVFPTREYGYAECTELLLTLTSVSKAKTPAELRWEADRERHIKRETKPSEKLRRTAQHKHTGVLPSVAFLALC